MFNVIVRKDREITPYYFLRKHSCILCGRGGFPILSGFSCSAGKFDPGSYRLFGGSVQQIVDQIVYLPETFTIVIDYPLRRPAHYTFTLAELNWSVEMSLKVVLELFAKCYKVTYEKEIETASSRTFIVTKDCTECPTQNFFDFVQETTSEDVCSICQDEDDYSKKIYIKSCSHVFHDKCLRRWYDRTRNSCPMCRSTIVFCERCNNTGSYEEELNAPAVPYNPLIENFWEETNGCFGIYDRYYQDIFFNALIVDNKRKILHLSVNKFQ
jgi:hypothetical protein